ncbi:MAG: hypothetical protein AAFQ94_27000 [Bacteroidota bacterium]
MRVLLFLCLTLSISAAIQAQTTVTDESLNWPGTAKGSTHELAMTDEYVYVTGQNMHAVAKVSYDGKILHYPMPDSSGPHGIIFDKYGRLWVSLEFHNQVVQLDKKGKIIQTIDVNMNIPGSRPIGTAPHGLGLDADGETIWFTGKRTSTVGKINPDGTIEHFELKTLGAVPIYLHAGPDGNMWGTELVGNNILKVTPSGKVSEYAIPTNNSRPIAIKPGPNGIYMWFTEEAGHRIGRVDMQGNIVEFQVRNFNGNEILAGLAFDQYGNLWTQSYVDQNNPTPAGTDYIVKIDKAILTTDDTDLSDIQVDYYAVPTTKTVMHRIKEGKDGNIYFTELKQDKLGKVVVSSNKK